MNAIKAAAKRKPDEPFFFFFWSEVTVYLEWTVTLDLKQTMTLHLDVPESDKKQQSESRKDFFG